jgi:hypothetical protein
VFIGLLGLSRDGFGAGKGAEDWNRTSDTSIFSAVLYRLSYLGMRGRGQAEWQS